MVFNSIEFLLFLPIVVILYYVLPQKMKIPLLLLGSYAFYACYNLKLSLFLVAFTLVTYVIGKIIAASVGKKKKAYLALGIVAQTLTLAVYKYTNFFLETFSDKEVKFDLLVPLGISFITFSGISYLIDVYREKIAVENRIHYFALYMAFFPKVVQGPIIKYGDVVSQFDEKHSWSQNNFRAGTIQVLYGLFMKMVIADRMAVAVNMVYGSASDYAGATLLLATLLFSLQIYFDFAGYSLVALGSARLLGFTFADNFRQPYLSTSVSEFWKRWHISLNKWLTDYIYIPLGGSRCTPVRRDVNTLITFGLSGLWHGAAWGYVIWGLLNGVYIVVEKHIRESILPLFKRNEKLSSLAPKDSTLLGQVVTFVLISFSWIFFRAQSLELSTTIITKIFTEFNFFVSMKDMATCFTMEEPSYLGLTLHSWSILVLFFVISWIVDIIVQKWNLVEEFPDFRLPIRWTIYLVLIFTIILFGMYGYGYSAGAFIYAQF